MLFDLRRKRYNLTNKLTRLGIIHNSAGPVPAPFDPGTYDPANLIQLLNGDIGLTNASWQDQSGNGYNLTWNNLPTVTPAFLNGHQVVTLNGTTQNGFHSTIPITERFTWYVVFNCLNKVALDAIWQVHLAATTPTLRLDAGNTLYYSEGTFNPVPDITNNTWHILTIVNDTLISYGRVDLNAAVNGAHVAYGGPYTGQIVGSRYIPPGPAAQHINGIYAYSVLRSGNDSTAVQNQFINYFKSRFSI